MRRRLATEGGAYFSTPPKLQFVQSGASPLDCVLGWGWPLGRVVNIVGDESSGKTLVAMEAMINCARQFPDAHICYRESEAALVKEYAAHLGLPLDRVELAREVGTTDTVERFYDHLMLFLKKLDGAPGFYVLDSLDALSDEAEMDRDIDKNTMGTQKAKKLSELFRKVTEQVESSKVCLMIVSQTRDKIGGGFGRKYTRAGGKALNFYASIIVYLAHIGELKRQVSKVKRTVGVSVRAKCTKNKIGLPFRQCDFPIIFGYGIEDIYSALSWLKEHGRLGDVNLTEKVAADLMADALNMKLVPEDVQQWRAKLTKIVPRVWWDIEKTFLPARGKYNQ